MKSSKDKQKTLNLDTSNKKFLGVCAGVANYLEVEHWTVRLVFFLSIIFGGWFLIPIYFIAWFCLDEKPGQSASEFFDSHTFKHFRTVDYKKKVYRNPEDAKFLGVCSGIAEYLEINVFAVRLGFLILVLFTAMLPIIVYFAAYFILEEKPVRLQRRHGKRSKQRHEFVNDNNGDIHDAGKDKASRASEFSNTQQSDENTYSEFDKGMKSKRKEINYCVRKFKTLQHRLAKMEAYVTSSQFHLHREFKNI